MMKIHGAAAEMQKHEGFTEMPNIAIALSPEAMEKCARFVMHAASDMKRMGTGYDHMHFMDFCKDRDPVWPDIQLTRMYDDA